MNIKTITEFIDWTEKLEGSLMLYRGLSDSNMELEASGYRRLKTEKEPVPPMGVFHNYITWLLNRAKLQGFRQKQGNKLFDLELLAELQHNGAATCLIDFTANPLIALWFACQENPGKNGKVAAMATGDPGRFAIVDSESVSNPIMEFFREEKLWKWTPAHQNNRIVAQNSVFVFGKEKIAERYYETIEIEEGDKKSIIRELRDKFGIDETYLFSDFTGFSLVNAHNKPYSDYGAEDYFFLGVRCSQRAEHGKAIEYYGKAIELNPQDAEAYNNRGAKAYYNRGNAKGDLGDHEGAIADYDQAIELDPQDAGAYNNRGVAKRVSGDHQGAIADYDQAIALDPQYAEAYNNHGNAKHDLGDHQGAIADYDQAIALNPQFAKAYYNRGIAKSDLGDHPGAIADYDQAIDLNPQSAEAYYNRGIAKKALGDDKGARADWDRAIQLDPSLAKR